MYAVKISIAIIAFLAVFLAGGLSFNIQAASTCCTIIIVSNLDTDFTIYGPQTFTKKDVVTSPSFTAPAGKYLWEIRGASPGTYTLSVKTISGYEVLYSKTFTIPEGYDYFTSNNNITYNVAGSQTTSPMDSAPVSQPPSSLQSPCAGTVTLTDTGQMQPGILVASNAQGAKFTITGPATYTGPGVAWYKPDVPTGTYTIIWSPVAGCEIPPSETKTLQSGKWIGFAGNYKDTSVPTGYGVIEIKTNLSSQLTVFLIKGPTQKVMKGTSASWLSAPSGTYTVSYGEVSGFVTPPPETKTLDVGSTINFYGNYKTEDVIKKTEPSPQLQNILDDTKNGIQIPEKTLKEIPQVAPSVQPKPQRNFFFRIQQSIFSFLKRLFSRSSPVVQPVIQEEKAVPEKVPVEKNTKVSGSAPKPEDFQSSTKIPVQSKISSPPSDLLGLWKTTKQFNFISDTVSGYWKETVPPDLYYEFKSDGSTCVGDITNKELRFAPQEFYCFWKNIRRTYKVDGDNLTIIEQGNESRPSYNRWRIINEGLELTSLNSARQPHIKYILTKFRDLP